MAQWEAACLPGGWEGLGVCGGIWVEPGVSDELPPIHPTLLTVRPKTFTSRLLSDP